MGRLLTTAQAAAALTNRNTVKGRPKLVHPSTVRNLIRTGRLTAKQVEGGELWLIDEDELESIRPPKSGRTPMVPHEDWLKLKHEVTRLGRSVRKVAEAHGIDAVTLYRMLARDKVELSGPFIPPWEWAKIAKELARGEKDSEVAAKYCYPLALVRNEAKKNDFVMPGKVITVGAWSKMKQDLGIGMSVEEVAKKHSFPVAAVRKKIKEAELGVKAKKKKRGRRSDR